MAERKGCGDGFTRPRIQEEKYYMGSYKISKEKRRGLFDLTLSVESLQFNDPRYTDDRFHVCSLVSIKSFSGFLSDSAFLFSVFSILAIC